jgi:hypothetical protein
MPAGIVTIRNQTDQDGGIDITLGSSQNVQPPIRVFSAQGALLYSVGQSGSLTVKAPLSIVGPNGLSGDFINGVPFAFNEGNPNFTADADLNLLNVNPIAVGKPWLVVTSGVSLTATRKLIVPISQGGFYIVTNSTTGAQAIQVIGLTGTGVTIANARSALVICDGTNWIRLTADSASP